jgi:tryptophan synthase beta chain
MQLPDQNGHFGKFGGRFVPETLMSVLEELAESYEKYKNDPYFIKEFKSYLKNYVGRPSPLYFAKRFSEQLKGAKIYLKREDCNHTGAHKINNALGQALLAKYMGKHNLIAETGAGQHGLATATVAALFGMECKIFMGEIDMARQEVNVEKMRMLGAEVIPVTSGSKTLKDAMNETFRYWMAHPTDTYYLVGTVAGPHPYPMMVRDFQTIIGYETFQQIKEDEQRLPDYIVACVGGGSNAAGIFFPFLKAAEVKLIGVEAAGKGLDTEEFAATLVKGKPGVFHGTYSYVLQDPQGQILEAHSISAGLDYPGVGPEHSFLKDVGRVEYRAVTDAEAVKAHDLLVQTEGIIPALESAHALAEVMKLAPTLSRESIIVVCVSGRGDKDMHTIQKYKEEQKNHE